MLFGHGPADGGQHLFTLQTKPSCAITSPRMQMYGLDVESEDYAKLAWVAVDVNAGGRPLSSSATKAWAKKSRRSTKDASYQMMTANDGKLSFKHSGCSGNQGRQTGCFPG